MGSNACGRVVANASCMLILSSGVGGDGDAIMDVSCRQDPNCQRLSELDQLLAHETEPEDIIREQCIHNLHQVLICLRICQQHHRKRLWAYRLLAQGPTG